MKKKKPNHHFILCLSYKIKMVRVTKKVGFKPSYQFYWHYLGASAAPCALESVLEQGMCRTRRQQQCYPACPWHTGLEGVCKIFALRQGIIIF